jgi:hypothetical protein
MFLLGASFFSEQRPIDKCIISGNKKKKIAKGSLVSYIVAISTP